MTDLYRHTFRGLMIDQHFPDEPFITFSNFDPKQQIELCQKDGDVFVHILNRPYETTTVWLYQSNAVSLGALNTTQQKLNSSIQEKKPSNLMEMLSIFLLYQSTV